MHSKQSLLACQQQVGSAHAHRRHQRLDARRDVSCRRSWPGPRATHDGRPPSCSVSCSGSQTCSATPPSAWPRMGYVAIAPDLLHRRAPGGPLPEDEEGRRQGLALIGELTRLELVSDVRDALTSGARQARRRPRSAIGRRRDVVRRARRDPRHSAARSPRLRRDVRGLACRHRYRRITP